MSLICAVFKRIGLQIRRRYDFHVSTKNVNREKHLVSYHYDYATVKKHKENPLSFCETQTTATSSENPISISMLCLGRPLSLDIWMYLSSWITSKTHILQEEFLLLTWRGEKFLSPHDDVSVWAVMKWVRAVFPAALKQVDHLNTRVS